MTLNATAFERSDSMEARVRMGLDRSHGFPGGRSCRTGRTRYGAAQIMGLLLRHIFRLAWRVLACG